ncbi:S9 family peptidase [Salipaludibacillus sp. CUR1]|uniref:S9 family peptidase n=1 Tax=Salipaludibacillus sp. CUR1 TaxID=2820003 RepID=UPI001E3635E9|nr:S9 family peptidase [Salipaludibacillus sp. CUR1]MCE7790907.1 S9 family peptidase [Salipaludibacillus sp. CUR1]
METKRTLTIDDLKNINVLTEPQPSPDGKEFAFVRQFITEEDNYNSHLFVQRFNEDTPRQWTYGPGKVLSPRYSPDGRWIVFVSAKEEKAKPQLYLLPLDGGEAKQVTKLPNGASQPYWSPDSSKILFTTSFEKGSQPDNQLNGKGDTEEKKAPLIVERLKYKSDAAGFLDETNKQLALYDLNKDAIEFITDDEFDDEPSGWSPDGKMIAYHSNKQGDEHIGSDIYMMDINTKEHYQLTDGKGIFSHGVFSPDGKKIACYGHTKQFAGATHSKLWIIDVAAHDEKKCLTNHWDVHMGDSCIGDILSGQSNPGPLWTKDGKSLLVQASVKGSTNLYNVSLSGDIEQVTSGDQHVYSCSLHQQSGKIIAGISTPVNPGEIYSSSLEDRSLNELTSMNKPFTDKVNLQTPEEIISMSKDGKSVQGWLLKPAGFTEGETYPGILEIHGGPHAMYGNTFFHELQLLAAKGYAVFYANPRGSHGYGQEFVNACRGDYGGMDYEDVMVFTDTVTDHYPWIDKKRLGVTGGSYGGFMTNWIVGHTNRFKAAATLRCISNWISFYGVSDIGYFFTEWEIGTDLLKDPDKLWKHSPLKYVNQIETPLLIMHGEKDFRCPIEQAEQLFTALKQSGKDTRFVRFPDANHELSRSGPPHLRKARLQELTQWFEKHLK